MVVTAATAGLTPDIVYHFFRRFYSEHYFKQTVAISLLAPVKMLTFLEHIFQYIDMVN
jgi:hypothetical protein